MIRRFLATGLSIFTALIILLAGMHISVARHYCEGNLAAVKISFSGKLASCGMREDTPTNDGWNSFDKDCCHDFRTTFNVSSPYTPTAYVVNTIPHFPVLGNLLNESSSYRVIPANIESYNSSPPGVVSWASSDQALICQFLI